MVNHKYYKTLYNFFFFFTDKKVKQLIWKTKKRKKIFQNYKSQLYIN